MSNINVTEGSGKTVATETVAGVEYGLVKLADATAGSTTRTGVAANPFQVSIANTGANGTAIKVDGSAVTQPVSGTVTITPSGTQTISGTVSTNADAAIGAGTAPSKALVGGAVYNSTEISPSTGQTFAVQGDSKGRLRGVLMDAAGNTRGANVDSTNNLAVNIGNYGSAGAPPTGSGTTTTATPRIVIATDSAAIATAGFISAKIDQTTPGTTNAVSLAQIGGTTILNGGVVGSQSMGGTVATNVAINANPLNLGAQAVSSENTAVTTARQVQLVADLVGKLIVLPYANPENFVSGAITSAMTGTTTTSLIAAPASGLRNYITQITVSNAHATQGTDVIIQDGSGGTTLYTIPAAAVYGGAVVTFPTPLRQPTTATAIYCANVTTGASTKVSASGYKGA